MSLKFQFHLILPKALRNICLNGLHLRNTAFRIVWKLSQEFEVFESFAPVPIFPGFLDEKKALKDTEADLGGEGGKGAAPPFFPCIFKKERDYSFGFGRWERGEHALPEFLRTHHLNFLDRPLGHAFPGSRKTYLSGKLLNLTL